MLVNCRNCGYQDEDYQESSYRCPICGEKLLILGEVDENEDDGLPWEENPYE